ncbi:hypothetical protein ABE51_15520 [Bacillus thuringiensis]|uniref:Uncharacterized protein n=1 Tax=Bacillus thuringiensis Bt18247 TaxID=1423143 RepID=A0A9W3SPJ0_BACTU|nr:hypothetical protein BTI247_08460 [Bacillus thuringiensis Bt18247]MBG9526539.1 hypothetical protein [Bacillus thuringiensis]
MQGSDKFFRINKEINFNKNAILLGEYEMKDTWNEQESLDIEAEQEMIVQAEQENWMEANNISYEY